MEVFPNGSQPYDAASLSLFICFFSGFSSIKDKQELTICSFNKQRIKNTRYEDNYILNSLNRATKSTVIFGNNAVGKTNILYAIHSLLDMIRTGRLLSNVKLFNFRSQYISYEIIVETNEKIVYTYSLTINKSEEVIAEVLKRNNTIIYDYEDTNLTSDFLDEKILDIYSITSTSTILSKIKDFIKDIYDEFISTVTDIIVIQDSLYNVALKNFEINYNKHEKVIIENNKKLVQLILAQVDSTITDIEFVERTNEEGELRYGLIICRNIGDNEVAKYSFAFESNGVKKIIGIIISLLKVYLGKTIIIDELDSSISTRSLILLFNKIINTSQNKKGQLIVTTHNLNLFDLTFFAPEQLYIVYKDADLTTKINSLADFKLRSNKKNLASEFLKGQFEG